MLGQGLLAIPSGTSYSESVKDCDGADDKSGSGLSRLVVIQVVASDDGPGEAGPTLAQTTASCCRYPQGCAESLPRLDPLLVVNISDRQ